MEIVTLQAKARSDIGTRPTRRLRTTGELPGIIYGHKETPEAISLDRHDFELAVAHGARTLDVVLNGQSKRYLIKEVQYDHRGDEPIHVDLARVDIHERVRVRVAIELRGIPKGLSEGGVLEQHLANVEVECQVLDIPETLHPLVSELTLGQSLYVRDIPLPAGVVAVTSGDDRVASVRALLEKPEAAAAPVEGEVAVAEPERIGRVRKDEEEGEAEKK